jgi:hypothetical protein
MFETLVEYLNKLSIIIYSNPLYFGSLQIIELLIFLKLIYWDNIFNLSVAHPLLTQASVTFIIFFYLLLFFFLLIKASPTATQKNAVPPESKIFTKAFGILAFLGVIVSAIFLIGWLIKHYFSFFTGSIFHYLFFFFLLVSSLSIIYTFFSTKLNSLFSAPLFAFLFQLVMFMPCLLLRFIDYIKYQCKITTKPIWFLLAIEIVLVALYFLIPKTLATISNYSGGVQLLKEPVYLNHPLTLGSFEDLHSMPDANIHYKYHYSLSAWFYINPQPPATSAAYTKYTDILNYGSKPIVQYNGLANSLRVVAETGDGGKKVTIFETKEIVYQKWNNIVINYDGGSMDVFLNGELVGSSPNVVSYMRYENVDVGALNGIQGGICNVIYYDSIVPKSKIVSTYRLLRNKKVPL